MMAGGGGMEPVNGLGGNPQSGVVPEGDIGHGDIVVDGFGKGKNIDATHLVEMQRILLGAAPAQTDQAVQLQAAGIGDGDIGHIHDLGAHFHFVRLVAAGSQKSSPERQDAAHMLIFDRQGTVFHKAAKSVQDPNHPHVMM